MFLYFYISFVQCKKHEKHPWKSVAIQPATLLKVAPHPPPPHAPHGCFSRFLNFTNGAKSHKVSYMVLISQFSILRFDCEINNALSFF